MTDKPRRSLRIEQDLQHPLWIPGQAYTDYVMRKHHMTNRGQGHSTLGELPDIDQLATADMVHDLVGRALDDYQGIHQLCKNGDVYFPFSFNLRVGSTLQNLSGKRYAVTIIRDTPDSVGYVNPYYRWTCGQIVKLDSVPAYNEILRLDDAAKLDYKAAFEEEEIVGYLQNSQLEHHQGFACRIQSSVPFVTDRGVEMKYGFTEGHMPHPYDPSLQFEVRRYDELTTYEFLAFARENRTADQLYRYLQAVLRMYAKKLKEHGIDVMCWKKRGPDRHITRGSEGGNFQTNLHLRSTFWEFKTAETLISMERLIDHVRIDVTPYTAPMKTEGGELKEGKGHTVVHIFEPEASDEE